MGIRPTVQQVPEDPCIPAPASRHEHELAASAQAIDGEKHLVPCQIGAVTRHVFEVAGTGSEHVVDHLIFYDYMLCHPPPPWEQNALLQLHGFPLEMRIGNDALTFHTAHLAGDVFLFRDAVADHAPVCTDAGRAHWESL
jgi:hypothetical protein